MCGIDTFTNPNSKVWEGGREKQESKPASKTHGNALVELPGPPPDLGDLAAMV